MAVKISKNARANRGSGVKPYMLINAEEVEISPVLFIGTFAENGKFMAVQEKKNKKLILDENGIPLPWSSTVKIYK